MEEIKLETAEVGQNNDICKTLEYSFNDKDIDVGVATLSGRYPKEDYCVNLVSKELIYVLEGSGSINFENKKVDFKTGDAILILPNEKYYWETTGCKVSMTCTPAFSVTQYKLVK